MVVVCRETDLVRGVFEISNKTHSAQGHFIWVHEWVSVRFGYQQILYSSEYLFHFHPLILSKYELIRPGVYQNECE